MSERLKKESGILHVIAPIAAPKNKAGPQTLIAVAFKSCLPVFSDKGTGFYPLKLGFYKIYNKPWICKYKETVYYIDIVGGM
jgi:hypothetical protein